MFSDNDFDRVAALDPKADPDPRKQLKELKARAAQLRRAFPETQTHKAWLDFYVRILDEKIAVYEAFPKLRTRVWRCCCWPRVRPVS
jgi:beta-lactamase class A